MKVKPDFSGYATRHDMRCSDGLIIRGGAFRHQNGEKIPVFWRHKRDEVTNVLGHAVLSNRDDGVYADVYLNNTPNAQHAREMIQHGDINSLSIFANSLKKRGFDVLHGNIKEVSLVLSGANPGAFIDHVNLSHGDEDFDDGEGVIYTGSTFDKVDLSHEDEDKNLDEDETNENPDESEIDHADTEGDTMADTKEKTVEELYNEQSDEVKNMIAYLVGLALEEGDGSDDAEHSDEEDDDDYIEHNGGRVNYNIFEGDDDHQGLTLSHEETEAIFADARRYGKSLKDTVLEHAAEYGIEDIDLLFPDAKALENEPHLYKRRTEWVNEVLQETNHSPFAKVKTLVADITHDEARAKGYVKGNLKKDEFFKLQKRETHPATVYKKQKLDRDDILDINNFDVVAFMKSEMRVMLDEEIARAILIGDGREIDDEDKIPDPSNDSSGKGIRSIFHDHDFYAHKITVPANTTGDGISEAVIRGMDDYRGTGSPVLFTSRKQLTDLLLLKDKLGRRLYPSMDELASVLQVTRIVPVQVFESEPTLIGIVVNLKDYTVGANQGGQTSFFDDFDIDYNQNKYLLEARLSGGLTLPKSALVILRGAGTRVVPIAPNFDSDTNIIEIPSVTGVRYLIDDSVVTGSIDITKDTTVVAQPLENYFFVSGSTAEWTFSYNAG